MSHKNRVSSCHCGSKTFTDKIILIVAQYLLFLVRIFLYTHVAFKFSLAFTEWDSNREVKMPRENSFEVFVLFINFPGSILRF